MQPPFLCFGLRIQKLRPQLVRAELFTYPQSQITAKNLIRNSTEIM